MYAERGVVKLKTDGKRAPFAHLAKPDSPGESPLKTLCGKPVRIQWTVDDGGTICCEKCIMIFEAAGKSSRGEQMRKKQAKTRARLTQAPPPEPPAPSSTYHEDVERAEKMTPEKFREANRLMAEDQARELAEHQRRVAARVVDQVNAGALGANVTATLTPARASRRLQQKDLAGNVIVPPEVEEEVATTTRVKLSAEFFKASLTSEACIKLLGASRDTQIFTVGKSMSVKSPKTTIFIPEGAFEADREKLLRRAINKGEQFREASWRSA